MKKVNQFTPEEPCPLSELVMKNFNQLKVTLELPTPEGSSVDVIAPVATRRKNSDMSMISRDSNRKYIF